MIFAASFLGMFEIVLPNSFINKMDQQGDRGGYIGIFFIAFTLVLVSFSCTVPIVGSVAIKQRRDNQTVFCYAGFRNHVRATIHIICIFSPMAKQFTQIWWLA